MSCFAKFSQFDIGSMATKTLVFLIFPFSYGMMETFPEILRNCPEDYECVNRSNCPHFKQRYEEYTQTRNRNILNELKALICNEEEKALCCELQENLHTPRPAPEPPGPGSCGKPQRIPESVFITITIIYNYNYW